MRTIHNIWFACLLITSTPIYCQLNSFEKIILVIDTSYHNSQEHDIYLHKVLLQNEEGVRALLEVKNRLEDFFFNCIYLGSDNSLYIVFSNYGSAAGITRMYFIKESNNQIFESEPIYEYEIPICKSFDADSLIIRIVSFKSSEFGYLATKKVNYYRQQNTTTIDFKLNENYKKIIEIPLPLPN